MPFRWFSPKAPTFGKPGPVVAGRGSRSSDRGNDGGGGTAGMTGEGGTAGMTVFYYCYPGGLKKNVIPV
jgi:hypothetical protein